MERWRRRIFYMLLAYCAGMLLWASRPWTDTQRLVTPPEVPLPLGEQFAFARYRCPSVFSSATEAPEANEATPYPPADKPCSEQTSHRALFVVDLAAAGVGMVLVQRSSIRHRAAAKAADARDAELAS